MATSGLFATKPIDKLVADTEEGTTLNRAVGLLDLTALGIGAIIGTGIFVILGEVVGTAGPAIILSFVLAGVTCAFSALSYAELASSIPVSGSAYTYAYATLGELLAWIIGWDLILEYAMSAATVASAWSEYFNELMQVLFHWEVGPKWSNDPFTVAGAYLNLPAVVILALVTIILVIGIRESAASNTALVLVKLGVVLFVIAIGVGYITKANWTDIPNEERKLAEQLII